MNSKNNKKTKRKWPFLYDFVKVTGGIPTLILMRTKTFYPQGKPNLKGGVLISANHTGFLDPPLILTVFWKRRVYSLATKNLYEKKFWRWFFNAMQCIETDKDNFSMKSFHKTVNYLKDDKMVLIFPEGGVNYSEHAVSPFKSGAVLMAYKSGKPILPVYIPKVKKWYSRRYAVVGQPIDVKTLCGCTPSMEKINMVTDLIRQEEIKLEGYFNQQMIKKGKKNDEK